MAESDGAGRVSLHYRAYLPTGITVIIVVVAASALFPLYLLALDAGTLVYLAHMVVGVVPAVVVNLLLARDVVLSDDGRLTVTGLGQRIDVDVRCFTDIGASAGARAGFALARVRWDGGGFRMWQAMTYRPDPGRKFRKGRRSGSVSEDFRDLVYRLHLINPVVQVRGVAPPAWALPAAMPRPPETYWSRDPRFKLDEPT
ncbi:hypothetical protein [Actinomadura sp. 9N407]|uniref:hypothetical protein n=1 Tax=Actinomadura sp. 9N407 TaxID=3375154 RepID=UPI003796A37C